MHPTSLLLVLLLLTLISFWYGKRTALLSVSGEASRLHSLPVYSGLYAALWCALPALAIVLLWLMFENNIISQLVISNMAHPLAQQEPDLLLHELYNMLNNSTVLDAMEPHMAQAVKHYHELKAISDWAELVLFALAAGVGLLAARMGIFPEARLRNKVESLFQGFLILCSTVAIFTTLGIILSVLFEAIRFFESVPIQEFLFGTRWSPQMAIREDQVGSSGAFGAIPLFAGTLLISLIAMMVAAPVGLLSAIYLSEYASSTVRAVAKPLLEILAGIPTVVYGFFAALTVAPFLRDNGALIGLDVSSESALAAGLVMGIMIIPFVSSLSDDVINAVPQTMRDGSYGLGATRSETIMRVIIPAALPGIVGGMLLAVSRAIGETMIVVMAAGLSANLTANPLEAVTTVTVQIVTLLVGDQEFDSPKTLAAFALGLLLFVSTLILNIIALHVVRKYREQYE